MPVWSTEDSILDLVESPLAEAGASGGDTYLCRECRALITTKGAETAAQGVHQHVVTNPAGVTFHIGSFRTAPGTVPVSSPTTQDTWFPGYTWSIVMCQSCAVHLGWQFRSETGCFFGLILDRMVLEREAASE